MEMETGNWKGSSIALVLQANQGGGGGGYRRTRSFPSLQPLLTHAVIVNYMC